jgi:hypothetical protein
MAKAARETKMRYGMRKRVKFVAKTASGPLMPGAIRKTR